MKVPQILKIAKAKSAEGISPLGVTLEVFAVTASFCYGYSKQFPFRLFNITISSKLILFGFIVACSDIRARQSALVVPADALYCSEIRVW